MATTKLICVGQIFSYTEADTEHDAFIYLDPDALEFFVVEGREEDDGRYESDLIPVADYLRQHPEWEADVRQTVLDKMEPAVR
jgi:hypothetical protein